MRRVLLPLLLPGMFAVLAMGSHAQTKMYKCTGAGRTVYQQTACASEAPAASAPARPASAAASAGRASSTAR